jgi:hypothetical protein
MRERESKLAKMSFVYPSKAPAVSRRCGACAGYTLWRLS